MSKLLENITEINQHIMQGKALDAFETFYHDDVEMQENNAEPTRGKSANREREIEFFGAITEFRGAKPLHVTVGDNTTMVEWEFDFTHKDWGERKFTQISVQEWKDDQIIKERFYYN